MTRTHKKVWVVHHIGYILDLDWNHRPFFFKSEPSLLAVFTSEYYANEYRDECRVNHPEPEKISVSRFRLRPC